MMKMGNINIVATPLLELWPPYYQHGDHGSFTFKTVATSLLRLWLSYFQVDLPLLTPWLPRLHDNDFHTYKQF